MFQKRTRLEIVLFSIWFLDILAASLMLSSKRLNENYNDISVRFDKLDYFSLLLLRLEIWGFQKLNLYFSFAAFYTVYILCDFPIRSGTTRSQFFIWCCARDAFILLCFLFSSAFFKTMSICLPSLALRKWNSLCFSWGAISRREWRKVTSGWKWHRVRGKNHWIVFTNQWRWTMCFS